MVSNRIVLACVSIACTIAASNSLLRAEDADPVHELAPGVFFLEMPNQPKFIGANVGWIEFEDYVLVIDSGFAPGARLALEEIEKRTKKPVRFAFNTHYHPDHSFGNGIYVEAGATIVCTERCQESERKIPESALHESGDDAAKNLKWKPGTLTFKNELVFDDGKHHVELLHLGHAHTSGDAVAWLPNERILFTGDACVNGAFNFMGDSDSESWLRVLDGLAGLSPKIVAPGHGKLGDATMIVQQKRWFVELRAAVESGMLKGFTADKIGAGLDMPWYREWSGKEAKEQKGNVEHVFGELTGLNPPSAWIAEMGLKEGEHALRDAPGWSKPTKILVPATIPLSRLAYVAPGVELVPYGSPMEAASKVADADAILGFCNADVLERGKKLKWIAVGSAGVERYVGLKGFSDREVVLTNAQRVHGTPIAEHVFAMLLGLTRDLRDAIGEQNKGLWNADVFRGDDVMRELHGRTLFVVGLGGIGTDVARIGKGFGMRVIAVKRTPDSKPDFVDRLGGSSNLVDFAAEADFIVNCMPLTKETERLFDKKFFTIAKKGSYFVNIGRGKSVVTEDLVAALNDGRVRGAGLDVSDPEPLNGDSPLWKMKNVIITPHVSAESDTSDDRVFKLFRENLRRFVNGDALLNVVDLKAGY